MGSPAQHKLAAFATAFSTEDRRGDPAPIANLERAAELHGGLSNPTDCFGIAEGRFGGCLSQFG